MVTMRPSGFGKVQDVFPTAYFDPVIGRHVVRPSDFPEVVATATGANVELVPDLDLAAFLRRQAERMDTEAAFLDQLPPELYRFQRAGTAFLHGNPTAFLFDDMGLGKTPQALIAAGRRVVVVCPASLRLNWSHEVRRWRPDLDPVVIKPGNSFAWPDEGQCVIVSYAGTPQKPKDAPPGVSLVADEAHLVKSYKAARTRRFRSLARRVMKADGTVWLMTGTPVLANPKELWALLQALGLGKTLYRSWNNFTKVFGGFTDSLGVTHWDSKRVTADAMGPLRGYVLRRKRVDVLKDMPPKSRTYRHVELVTHDKLTTELLDRVDDAFAELLLDAADSADASMDYFGGIEGLAQARKALAAAKIPALLDIVESYRQAQEPLVVFSAHRAPIEHLAQLPGWGGVHGGIRKQEDRDKAVADFQAGRLAGIACTVGAAGMGYTLTRAAHCVFVDPDWTPAMNLQAEDRVARIGQKRPVSIIRLMADHPLDEKITDTLARKILMIENTTERLNEDDRPEHDRRQTAAALRHIASLIDGAG